MTINELKQISCCFTGHRVIKPQHLHNIFDVVYSQIRDLHMKGYVNFLCGGALGFDTICAKAVLMARSEYPSIKLILVLPCRNQTAKWKQSDVDVYNQILNQADKVIYTAEHYYDGCMHERNRFLIKYTSFCIAYKHKEFGGTAHTIKLANYNNVPTVNIADILDSTRY